MKTAIQMMTIAAVFVALAMFTTTALADPLPGQQLKFIQQPMIATEIQGQEYYGHDECSTARNSLMEPDGVYDGYFMADDFADTSEQSVAHVQWWGSYIDTGTPRPPGFEVSKFLICFERDVPADPDTPGSFSHPGEVLSSQIVTVGRLSPGSGTFTETLISGDPTAEQELFKYNAELRMPFTQQKDTVYWLKIVALMQLDQRDVIWGWHNRDYTIDNLATASPVPVPGEHVQGELPGVPDGEDVLIWHFQDNAVSGHTSIDVLPSPDGEDIVVGQGDYEETYYIPQYDGPGEIGQYSKDLAFALYTPVPEPATGLLLAMGFGCLLGWRRAKRG